MTIAEDLAPDAAARAWLDRSGFEHVMAFATRPTDREGTEGLTSDPEVQRLFTALALRDWWEGWWLAEAVVQTPDGLALIVSRRCSA